MTTLILKFPKFVIPELWCNNYCFSKSMSTNSRTMGTPKTLERRYFYKKKEVHSNTMGISTITVITSIRCQKTSKRGQ